MIKHLFSIAAALFAATMVAQAATPISPADKGIVYTGRVNFTNPESVSYTHLTLPTITRV